MVRNTSVGAFGAFCIFLYDLRRKRGQDVDEERGQKWTRRAKLGKSWRDNRQN
jgi:hypothetical protein